MIAEHRWNWYLRLLPAALFVVALILRVWALGAGLPFVENVDEPAVLEVAVRMVRNGDPNPHEFVYPSLCFYLFAVATRLYIWWSSQLGSAISPQDLPLKNYSVTTAPMLFIWNRAVTALLGAATVPALWALSRRMFDWRVGLLSALLLMVARFHVEQSHNITIDTPTGLWVVLALLGAWQITTTGRWRGYVLASVAVGLAAGTKYNAGVVALAVGLAHILHWRRALFGLSLLRLGASGLIALLVFLATTPYALLDWGAFVTALRFNAEHYSSGSHGDFIGRWQIGGYSTFLWNRGLLPSGSKEFSALCIGRTHAARSTSPA